MTNERADRSVASLVKISTYEVSYPMHGPMTMITRNGNRGSVFEEYHYAQPQLKWQFLDSYTSLNYLFRQASLSRMSGKQFVAVTEQTRTRRERSNPPCAVCDSLNYRFKIELVSKKPLGMARNVGLRALAFELVAGGSAGRWPISRLENERNATAVVKRN
ncbi:hypothetical protein EVAR_6357_1 [Eumeta japonica]|uniref:Uncharacterized protein n=1 Tax=Eumeta variegata TaxID=151549 RepID=A0A4C1TDG3_EUMVA|nr:hypothetical protein EVAR_6357_1 [Eumeta japonica]